MSFRLKPHPSWHRDQPLSITCRVTRAGYTFLLSFLIDAEIDRLVVPEPGEQVRRDGLWQSTCFELFLRPVGGRSYFEFNMVPAGAWAAYRFENYRSGMAEACLEPALPINAANRIATFEQNVVLDSNGHSALEGELQIGLSAIIEARDGTKSYWALAHPDGPPDFHHDACFAASLPPIG
jgi:hypothetical protein